MVQPVCGRPENDNPLQTLYGYIQYFNRIDFYEVYLLDWIMELIIFGLIAGFAILMWFEAIRFIIHGFIQIYRESKSDSPAWKRADLDYIRKVLDKWK